jgi:methylated-DNA-[protein]-cysteine S-methyltransferase
MTQRMFYTIFQTAAGFAGLLGSEAGLRCVTLPQNSEEAARKILGSEVSTATLASRFFQNLIKRLQTYYKGHSVDFPDKVDLRGSTVFQSSVWQATRLIPYGETRSYGWIAGQIGQPQAARAVGQALHRNPLPIIIPCHRVIASDGNLGGFGGNEGMKNYLLNLEMTDSTNRGIHFVSKVGTRG